VTVEIVNLQDFVEVPEEEIRAALTHTMLEELGRELNISVAVVGDGKIAELNKTFRNEARPTDVLAFPLGEGEAGQEGEDVFGEIVISAERARHEAAKRNADPQRELILYAVHGMLHLTGYDDQSLEEQQEMRRREDEILKALASQTRSNGPS